MRRPPFGCDHLASTWSNVNSICLVAAAEFQPHLFPAVPSAILGDPSDFFVRDQIDQRA